MCQALCAAYRRQRDTGDGSATSTSSACSRPDRRAGLATTHRLQTSPDSRLDVSPAGGHPNRASRPAAQPAQGTGAAYIQRWPDYHGSLYSALWPAGPWSNQLLCLAILAQSQTPPPPNMPVLAWEPPAAVEPLVWARSAPRRRRRLCHRSTSGMHEWSHYFIPRVCFQGCPKTMRMHAPSLPANTSGSRSRLPTADLPSPPAARCARLNPATRNPRVGSVTRAADDSDVRTHRGVAEPDAPASPCLRAVGWCEVRNWRKGTPPRVGGADQLAPGQSHHDSPKPVLSSGSLRLVWPARTALCTARRGVSPPVARHVSCAPCQRTSASVSGAAMLPSTGGPVGLQQGRAQGRERSDRRASRAQPGHKRRAIGTSAAASASASGM